MFLQNTSGRLLLEIGNTNWKMWRSFYKCNLKYCLGQKEQKHLKKKHFKIRYEYIKSKISIISLTIPLYWNISTSYRTVPSPIWEIFSQFLIFWNLFHEPLGEWNSSKIWETWKIFADIVRGQSAITSLSLIWKYIASGKRNFTKHRMLINHFSRWNVTCNSTNSTNK